MPCTDCAAGMPPEKFAGHRQQGRHGGGPWPSFGVVITNRSRAGSLVAYLTSLAPQEVTPVWLVLCDLNSDQPRPGLSKALTCGRFPGPVKQP